MGEFWRGVDYEKEKEKMRFVEKKNMVGEIKRVRD